MGLDVGAPLPPRLPLPAAENAAMKKIVDELGLALRRSGARAAS
jgi:4-hydroxy-tetrahydrodipicolinate synthase